MVARLARWSRKASSVTPSGREQTMMTTRAKASAVTNEPEPVIIPKMLENQLGSIDMIQSMAAQVALTPTRIKPRALNACERGASLLRRSCQKAKKFQVRKYNAARKPKKSRLRYQRLTKGAGCGRVQA